MGSNNVILLALLCLPLDLIISKQLEVNSGEGGPSSEAAKVQLQKIQEQSEHMKYGKCWTKALEILQSGCRRLTDDVQRRIAYAFARCHLQASGRDIPECPNDKPVSTCTDNDSIADMAFNTYTEFFTHTQQICFHLQTQAWHEATEDTISRLADNSAEVATHLEHSSVVAQQMIARQNRSLKNQEVLLENEERLKTSMLQSVLDVRKSHDETKRIISEQRALFNEVFDRVAILQKTVLGEFSSIYTFAFYVGSTLLAYILTSTTRTSSARIWVFLILLLNAVTERFISQHYINEVDNGTSFAGGTLAAFIPELIYEQTWLCRQIFSGFALLVLLVSACRYKDYNKINNTLLNEIKQQNQELQQYIRENIHDGSYRTVAAATTRIYSSSTVVKDKNDINDEAIGKQLLLAKYQSDVATLSHNESAENVTLSDADTIVQHVNVTRNSIDSREFADDDSDCTFVNFRDNSDASSSITTISSRSHHSDMDRMNSTITSRRSSTPMRESSLVRENSSRSSVVVTRSRRRSMIVATHDDSVSFVEPPVESVTVGGYSLRRRPASSSLVNKSFLKHETVEQFTSYVLHDLATQSTVRRSQIHNHLTEKNKKIPTRPMLPN